MSTHHMAPADQIGAKLRELNYLTQQFRQDMRALVRSAKLCLDQEGPNASDDAARLMMIADSEIEGHANAVDVMVEEILGREGCLPSSAALAPSR